MTTKLTAKPTQENNMTNINTKQENNMNKPKRAVREFAILRRTTEDAIILPFEKEILALVDKFNNSGQSGGSAPYTAAALSQAVKNLCLQNPICDITGNTEDG
jgi:hypothetical protein